MTHIVSYNILAGGYTLQKKGARRTEQLTKIIRSAQPDVVGLVEAIHPQVTQRPWVAEEVAENLGMQLIKGGTPARPQDYQLALLTRLPVLSTQIHARPGKLLRPLLEVCVEQENGQPLTVFVAHLSAAFNQGRGGGHIRMREVREILSIMAPLREQGRPHVLMGDFNSLAPGESFTASELLRYVVQLDNRRAEKKLYDGNPYLDSVVPRPLRFLIPLLKLVAVSKKLGTFFEAAAYYYAPRGCIRLLYEAGYVDSYRRKHPGDGGYTCPAEMPAGRIDYIFADPTLSSQLLSCEVITEADGVSGKQASDHLALHAEFGDPVKRLLPEFEEDQTSASILKADQYI